MYVEAISMIDKNVCECLKHSSPENLKLCFQNTIMNVDHLYIHDDIMYGISSTIKNPTFTSLPVALTLFDKYSALISI